MVVDCKQLWYSIYLYKYLECYLSGTGILKTYLSTKAHPNDIANVTDAEMKCAVQYKVQRSNAHKTGGTIPDPPAILSPQAQRLLNAVEAGRKVTDGTTEHALQMRKQIYALRTFFGSQQVYFTISPDDLKLSVVLRYAGISEAEIKTMTAE